GAMDIRDQTPQARTDGLLVEEMDGETLVYDLQTHAAHCLNPAATLVWRRSDGRTTVRAMVPFLGEVGLPEEESLVWMALSRLDEAGLVGSVTLPGPKGSFSRKDVLRVLGAAAAMTLLLPAVDSVVAPLAAAAASCISLAACTALPKTACGGLPICTNKTLCCKRQGSNCAAVAC
ncbi:MAG: hypothetical protein Q8N53_10630, partial [Longimicrobiales bacterium]|nr:hypothetical protein [Longimicrobiales bacterium]